MRIVKPIMFIIGMLVMLSLGYTAYRLYPRHVTLSLRGVQYQLHSLHHRRTVSLILKGTLHRSLFAKETFDGIISVRGATISDRDNGKPLTIVFNVASGGTIIYTHWNPLSMYEYGSIFTNRDFNQFVILEFQPIGNGTGWNAQTGIVIAAPAHTPQQAVDLSNVLLRTYLKRSHVQLSGKT